MLTRQYIQTPFGIKLQYYIGEEAVFSEYSTAVKTKKKTKFKRAASFCYAIAAGALMILWPVG